MKKNLLHYLVAVLVGAFVASPAVAAAAEVQFRNASGSAKTVSPTNQLPVSAYPVWGADTAQTIYTASTLVTLTASTKYAIFCTQTVCADLGDSSVTAAIGERVIPAGYVYPLMTSSTEAYVAIIGSGGSGGRCTFSVDGGY